MPRNQTRLWSRFLRSCCFFQAEDGIRDWSVTGVQTCALPISCTIGPYSTIGPNVVLGENCRLISHVVLVGDEAGHLTVGAGTTICPFACVGVAPQDLKYAGEPTRCILGANNTIREYVTISRGTAGGGGETTLGDGCLIMAYVHIGHDSHIGNGCILANSATLAGHVTVE